MAYVITEPCVDELDKSCIDECPVDCIYEGARMMYIHPNECVDCAACSMVCPVDAIFFKEDVPDKWLAYIDANAFFFEGIGSPGGAITVGRIDRDVDPAAGLSPRTSRGLPVGLG